MSIVNINIRNESPARDIFPRDRSEIPRGIPRKSRGRRRVGPLTVYELSRSSTQIDTVPNEEVNVFFPRIQRF